jgi:DNA helicase-2/ATP-dependent DNA helicase PcrA
MTHVEIIHGAPGAGKTHSILDATEHHHREDGISPGEVRLANFTNNGREETADDLVEREIFDLDAYGMEEDDLRRVCRTLHSIALGCCRNAHSELYEPKEQVITLQDNWEFYEAFCREWGLSLDKEETNPLKLITNGKEDTAVGNKLLGIDQWLHAMYLPSANRLGHLIDCPVGVELPNSRAREILRAWDEYKRDGGNADLRRFEHHDYVDACLENGYAPGVRLLCIDEFQDLSPVEYALYKLWRDSGRIDWIYIAGDVNQSIYSFRCATPFYLSATDVDGRQYLTESYRCPEAVSGVAQAILEAEPSITQNVFRTAELPNGRVPDGSVSMQSVTSAAELAETVRTALDTHDRPDGEDAATVYLLTRTNWQLGVLTQALQRRGVPFDAMGEKMTPWPEFAVDCLLALRALQRGTPAPQGATDTLIETATNSERREERLNNADVDRRSMRYDHSGSVPVYYPEQVSAAFPNRTAAGAVGVLDLPEYQCDMIRGALETDAAPYPERVQVGTIHEAKGLEAPCVMLFTETTGNIIDRYEAGETRAEEHRIMYVGATRASETLSVLDGFFDGPRSPIFADGLPGHGPQSAAEATEVTE